jgi:hypothetical protein
MKSRIRRPSLAPPSHAIDVSPGAANVLAVLGRQSTFNFWINGRQVAQLDDTRFRQGKVGLEADKPRGSDHVSIDFSNFAVWHRRRRAYLNNPEARKDDQGTSKMQTSSVVLGLLLPTNEKATKAVHSQYSHVKIAPARFS